MSCVVLPYQFNPRDYQSRLLHAIFVDKKQHCCCVWHRRAGKTKTCCNIIAGKSQERVGLYGFLLPELKQARRNVWEARGEDGIRFIDHFPSEMIHKVNNAEMFIEFKNGSIFRLLGSDRYDVLRGINPLGLIYDEYSLQNPYARDILVPIIAENNGWEIFIYTPKGGNHGYQLYQTAQKNDDWFCELLTVDDTYRQDGRPVVSKQSIDHFKRSGWSDNLIDQEFYCSFDAAVKGAYFARQLKKAHQDQRIVDFPIDRAKAVHTAWDIGYRDAMAIWLFQIKKEGIFAIYYYENRGEDIQHYINFLHAFQRQFNIVFGTHYCPHDGAKHDVFTGKTLIQQCSELGLRFKQLPRIHNKAAHIELGRSQFNKFWFHATHCKRGLDCLREYHSKYNDAMGELSSEPVHNWASHGADAFLYVCQAVEQPLQQRPMQVIHNAVNQGAIF